MNATPYPKSMVHPSARKSIIYSDVSQSSSRSTVPTGGAAGTPDVLPPVTVNNASQEAYYRAKGYLVTGEALQIAPHEEYPIWLSHETKESVLVATAKERKTREGQGYFAAGKSDPDAVQSTIAMPYDPNAKHEEWPKIVDGVLVQDPNRHSGFQKYPMWVGDKLVNNEAEERLARGPGEMKPRSLGMTTAIASQSAASPKKVKQMSAAHKAAMAAGRAKAKAAREGKAA